MDEPVYLLSALLLVAVAVIIYQFNKLSGLKKRFGQGTVEPAAAVKNTGSATQGSLPADKQDDLNVKLIAILAHNCRGALRNVISLTDFYGKGQISKEQFGELIVEMGTTSRNDLDTFENILKWLKTQLKDFECKLLEINASSLLKQSIRNNISDINRKKISLTIKDSNENWVIWGDPQLLEFVMDNLINNAVKYSHPGGSIECVIGHPDGSPSGIICLEVVDNGIGMDEKTRERVFYHDKTIYTGTDGEKGAGIALVICRDFVEMQGGTLKVRSEQDKGTVVTLAIAGKAGLAAGVAGNDPLRPGS